MCQSTFRTSMRSVVWISLPHVKSNAWPHESLTSGLVGAGMEDSRIIGLKATNIPPDSCLK